MNRITRPVGKKIDIKLEYENDTTATGIIIPESSLKVQNTALVMDVGDKVEGVKKGDRVLYNVGAGVEYAVDGVKHKLINESDCIGVLN